MATLRFNPNEPLECALKFDAGKRVASRIPDAPDQLMYTLCGDDTIYVPLIVGDQIEKLGIKKMELISICKRVQSNITRWEVKRVSEAVPPPQPPPQPEQPSILESELARSIEQAKTQRVLVAPAGAQHHQETRNGNPVQPNSNAPIHHTTISKIMASALIAAFDATQEAERYAHAHDVELEFGTEDVRAIANTLFIQLSKEPTCTAGPQRVKEGTTWQKQ
jgi:hypothetical protein